MDNIEEFNKATKRVILTLNTSILDLKPRDRSIEFIFTPKINYK